MATNVWFMKPGSSDALKLCWNPGVLLSLPLVQQSPGPGSTGGGGTEFAVSCPGSHPS